MAAPVPEESREGWIRESDAPIGPLRSKASRGPRRPIYACDRSQIRSRTLGSFSGNGDGRKSKADSPEAARIAYAFGGVAK